MVSTHELEALRPYVRAVVARHAKAPDVPDLVQEVLLTCWRSWETCRRPHARKAWACTIARYKCARWWREAARDPDRAPLEVGELVPDAGPGPEESVHRALIGEALARLPDASAQMLLMTADGLSSPEIARVFNCSESAVRKRLYVARIRLRRCLEGLL